MGPTDRTPSSREARFRAVYEATYDDLVRFARRRVDEGLAEDVVADTFVVAWRRLDELPVDPAAARPWLFGVARATILNHRRGGRRREALAVRVADATTSPADDDTVSRLDLAAAWGRLSSAEQEVIALAVWEGLTSEQAGSVLGCTATAYRLRLSRARRALRRHLDPAPKSNTDHDTKHDTHPRTHATPTEGHPS